MRGVGEHPRRWPLFITRLLRAHGSPRVSLTALPSSPGVRCPLLPATLTAALPNPTTNTIDTSTTPSTPPTATNTISDTTTSTTDNTASPSTTSANVQNYKPLVTRIRPLSYLVLLWREEDSEYRWHAGSYFVAGIFGADDFKVRWTFPSDFHQPWNLQEKHTTVDTVPVKKQKPKHGLCCPPGNLHRLLISHAWPWSRLNFRFSCERRWLSAFVL